MCLILLNTEGIIIIIYLICQKDCVAPKFTACTRVLPRTYIAHTQKQIQQNKIMQQKKKVQKQNKITAIIPYNKKPI